MTVQENEAIARANVELYNKRDLDGIAALASADAELIDVGTGQVLRGSTGSRQFSQGFITAFPDSKCEIISIVANERSAVVEFWGRGTQTGPLVTPAGTIPPTGRKAEVRFCQVMEIQGGKIKRMRSYWDVNTMMTQLGLIPEAARP